MRIGIVISDPSDWTARALKASFTRRGANAVFLDFSELAAFIHEDIHFKSDDQDLSSFDCLIVRDLGRKGAHDVAFRFEALRSLERSGIPVINSPEAIALAANKFATTLALQRSGVPTPKTTVTTSPKAASKALLEYGKAVSKPLFGYKGKDILLLTEGNEEKLVEVIKKQGLVYLQEFIENDRPRDTRAFVVDGKVLGAIFRVAPPGQWISNLARGGRADPCAITDELEDLALRACEAVGAVYSGVDLLETSEGLKVIEVNGTPSGKGIFEALGVDVTEAIADHATKRYA